MASIILKIKRWINEDLKEMYSLHSILYASGWSVAIVFFTYTELFHPLVKDSTFHNKYMTIFADDFSFVLGLGIMAFLLADYFFTHSVQRLFNFGLVFAFASLIIAHYHAIAISNKFNEIEDGFMEWFANPDFAFPLVLIFGMILFYIKYKSHFAHSSYIRQLEEKRNTNEPPTMMKSL